MNFFPKLFRVSLLFLFITILCSCDPMTFDGIPPTCYPNTRWVCERTDVAIYFSVDENGNLCDGLFISGEDIISIKGYILTPRSSISTFTYVDETGLEPGLISGPGEFSENYFIMYVKLSYKSRYNDVPLVFTRVPSE